MHTIAAMLYKVKREARQIPAILDNLLKFVAKQERGSLGWFDRLSIEPVGKDELRGEGVAIAGLPDGRLVVVPAGAVVLVVPGATRVIAESVEQLVAAWVAGKTTVPTLDYDGGELVRFGRGAASTNTVTSARPALKAWLKTQGKPKRTTFDLEAYLGTKLATFDGTVPRLPKLEADLAAGKRPAWAAYAKWLAGQGHPIAAVIEADLAVVPRSISSATKKNARAVFHAYARAHLAPRYAQIAANFVHYTEEVFMKGASFRYGFLDKLDTFSWSRPAITQAEKLLTDDHARWARDLCPRGMKLASLDQFAAMPGLRELQFRWTDIKQVSSVAPLAGLRMLTGLNLGNSAVRDVAPLAKVPVVQLYLDDTEVRDVKGLARHATLEDLNLGDTDVKDISPLLSCKRLCHVNLYDSKVSVEDARKLVALVAKHKPSNPEYVMDGYGRGVSHHGDL